MTGITNNDILLNIEGVDNMETLNRDIVLKGLVGSHNYRLATRLSDKDYKVFVAPTFEELYKHKYFSKDIITPEEDNSFHDIRKLPELFFKSNLSYLEVLESNELHIVGEELKEIYNLRKEIFKMNLPKLFNSCFGMYKQKMMLLNKGTEGTQHLVDLHGYDTKQALHAHRQQRFLVDFEATDFEDFRGAMIFEGDDQEFMLSIRNGEFDQDVFEKFATHYLESKVVHLREKYYSYEPNHELKEHLDDLIMKLVKRKVVS